MRSRGTAALILVLAAGVAAGCGSDDEPEGAPIPPQAAADIESRLAEVERRMAAGAGACADIQNDTQPAVDSIVASLPSDVDPDVRDALQDSVDRLFELTEQECDEEKGQDTQTQPELPPETETQTEEAPTEPAPTETEEEPPPEEDEEEVPPEELPPGQDGELSPGQGGENPGQGNGGGAIVPEADE